MSTAGRESASASSRPPDPCGYGKVPEWTRLHHLLLVLLGVGVAVFFLATIRPGQEAGDASIFLNHAVNLGEGHPYTRSHFEPNPEAPGIGGIESYPPGLPLVFAAVYKVAGFDIGAFKGAMVLLFAVSLYFFGRLLAGRLYPGSALLVVAVVGLNPYFWDIKEALVSHIPFLFWTLLTLFLADRLFGRKGKPDLNGLAIAVLIGITMLMSMITRSVGIAIPAALGVFDLWQRRKWYPSWHVVIPVGVFAVLFFLQRAQLPAGSTSNYFAAALSEVSSPPALLKSIAANAKNYVVGCVTNTLLDNGRWPLFRYTLAAATLLAAGIGFVCRCVRRPSVLEPFAAAFSAIILIWPFLMIAYMIPMYFLMFYYAATAIDRVTLGDRTRRMAAAAMVIVAFGLTYLGGYDQLDFETLRQNVASENGLAFYEEVGRTTPREALFISREAADFALYAERRSMPPLIPSGDDPRYTRREAAELFRFLDDVGASYVVTGPLGRRYHPEVLPLWYLVRDYPERFEERMVNSEFGLYRWISPADPG